MCLREHVLDFFAGPDIPVRHLVLPHVFFPLRRESLAFADRLHDFKALLRIHAPLNQREHDVVSRTNSGLNGRRALGNEHLRIALPDIGAVCKPRNANQVGKALRLGLNDHVHREIGAELGNAERAELTAENILRLDTECLGALEKTHHLGGIERYVFDRIDLRQIL